MKNFINDKERQDYIDLVKPAWMKSGNSKEIIRRYKDKIKDLHFNKFLPSEIAEAFNLDITILKKYLSGPATKNYTYNGILYRRCKNCKLYKETKENYYFFDNKGYPQYDSYCKICSKKKLNNKRKIIKIQNGGKITEKRVYKDSDDIKVFDRYTKKRLKQKYGLQIMVIIGFLDGNRQKITKQNGRKRSIKYFPN